MELRAERVLPVPVDSDIINTAKQVVNQKANTVYLKQSGILDSKKEVRIFHNLINFSMKQQKRISFLKL